jgi:hypothetical protein
MGLFGGLYILGVFVGCYLWFVPRAAGVPRRFLYIITPAGLTRVVAATTVIQAGLSIIGGVWQRMTNATLLLNAKFYMDLPQSSKANLAKVVSGSAHEAYVAATGISQQARIYLSIEFAANTLVYVAVAWVAYRIATAVMLQRGFLKSMTKDLHVLALVILITQTLSQYFGSRADTQVGHELFGANDWAANVPHAFGAMNLPFWQLFVAAAIWVFASLMSKGVQLQRDTAGLV